MHSSGELSPLRSRRRLPGAAPISSTTSTNVRSPPPTFAGGGGMGSDHFSSTPLASIALGDSLTLSRAGKPQLEAQMQDLNDVLELHALDPVAALELWKAAASAAGGNSSKTPPAFLTGTASSSGSLHSPESTKELRSRLHHHTSSGGAASPEQQAKAAQAELRHRMRRHGSYPQRVLLALDPSVAACSAVELKRRAEAVAAESRRFQTDIRRWRAAMAREDESSLTIGTSCSSAASVAGHENDASNGDDAVEAIRALHALESELLDAKLEDLAAQADDMEARVEFQTKKQAVLLRQATRLLGPELIEAEVPAVITAGDLAAAVKATQVNIRDARYLQEQRRQQQQRLLTRAARKVESLEAELAERQRKAVAEANVTASTEAEREARVLARHERKVAEITAAAIAGVVRTEQQGREELGRASQADLKIIKVDMQVALLALRRSAGLSTSSASGGAGSVLDGPAFEMLNHNTAVGGGSRASTQRSRR